MPHECTNCGRTFPDGSKEMLSGCPDCGGNKFRYCPSGGRLDASDSNAGLDSGDAPDSTGDGTERDPADDASGSDPGDDPPGLRDPGRSGTAETVSNAASTLRDLVGSRDGSAGAEEPTSGESERPEGPEDAAQADARSSVVDPDDIGAAGGGYPAQADDDPTPDSGPGGATADPDRPASDADAGTDAPEGSNLAQLREELNDQFESIKIVEPGQYELNLMELYDREEYIISLQEDGRYVIEVPESWRGDQP